MKTLFSAIILLFCVNLALRAETVTLAPSADTTLFQNFPDNNLGAVMLAAGTTAHDYLSRALIKFDVSQIPANALITSARLRLTVVRIPAGPQPSTFTLRRVLRDWGEGARFETTTGAPASDGEATWNNRLHPSSPWEMPGGAVDVDFSSTASSSCFVSDLGTYLFDTSSHMVADVQHWLTNPSQNFGWMLISDSEETLFTARRFGSREDAVNAPSLEIEYSSFGIDGVRVANGIVRFSFPVEPLFTYTVESRPSLSIGSWAPLTNFTETVRSYDAAISDAATPPRGFYRVLKAPCNCQ